MAIDFSKYSSKDYDSKKVNRGAGNEARTRQKASVREAETNRRRIVTSNQTAQKDYQAAVEADFDAVASGKAEDVKDWKNIAAIAMSFAETDDEQAKDTKNALLQQYGEQLRPHLDVMGGADWWDKNFEEYVKPDLPWYKDVGLALAGGAGKFGTYLDQWGESTRGAIGGITAAIDQNDQVSAREGLQHAGAQALKAIDPTRAIPGTEGLVSKLGVGDATEITLDDGTKLSMDQNGDGTINMREAMGRDADAGGRLAGVFDLALEIIADPTTWLTLGVSAKAKVGMKTAVAAAQSGSLAGTTVKVVTQEGGEAVATKLTADLVEKMFKDVAQKGFKKLAPENQQLIKTLVREGNQMAIDGGAKTGKLGLTGRRIADAETMATEQMTALARGGRSGINVAGQTAVPTGRLGEVAGRGASQFKNVDEVITRPTEKGVESIATGTGRFGDDIGNLADGRVKGPKLPTDQVPGQKGLDFDAAERAANRFKGEAGKAQQLSIKEIRNKGFKPAYEKGSPALKRAVETYEQGVFIRPGVKTPTLKPAVAIKPMQQMLDLSAKELAPKGAKMGPRAEEISEGIIRTVVRDGSSRGVLGQVMDLPGFKKITENMSTAAVIRAVHGDRVADAFKAIASGMRNSTRADDVARRIGSDMHRGGLHAQSIKEFGSAEKMNKAMNEAMSSAEARERALATFKPKSAQLLNTLHGLRQELRQAALDSGVPESQLRNVDEYIPRVLTEETKNNKQLMDQLENIAGQPLRTSGDKLADNFLQSRTVAQNLENLFDVNDKVFEELKQAGIKGVQDMFETDIVTAFAARAESSFRALADVEALTGLTKITGDGGLPLAFRAGADELNKLTPKQVARGQIKKAGGNIADYQEFRLPTGDVFMVENAVAGELEQMRRIFGSPQEMGNLKKLFSEVNQAWATSATVGYINTAFHARNRMGNIFLNFAGGNKNAATFKAAYGMVGGGGQGSMPKILSIMREDGLTWAKAAEKSGVDPKTVRILTDARRLGVIGDGRTLDLLKRDSKTKLTGGKLNPINPDGLMNQPGKNLGTNFENGDRLALYIDQINKGATPEVAAQHVKKYLFDYGDLTRFESEGVRQVSRFYTFMRKNAGVQAYTLAHHPGRINISEKSKDGLLNAIFGSEDGEFNPPPWMPDAMTFALGGTVAAIDIETPFSSFAELATILGDPDLKDPFKQVGFNSYMAGVTDRAGMLFSGVPFSAWDFMNEMGTGRDAFTGRELDPENEARDTWLFGALQVLQPALGRLETQANRLGLDSRGQEDDGTGKGNKDLAVAILSSFAGLQMYEVGADTEGIGRYVMTEQLEELRRELKKAGIDVPTVDELREQGDLAMKNRVLETLMYGGLKEDKDGNMVNDSAAGRAQLLQLMPKSVRDAFVESGVLSQMDLDASAAAGNVTGKGGRLEAAIGSAEEDRQQDFDFAQALKAAETYIGRDLTEDERWTFVSAFGGALGITDQEALGVNPYRKNNLLNEEVSEAEEKAWYDAKKDDFDRRLGIVGMDWDTVLKRHPRISKMERNFNNARGAGWTDEEIRAAMYMATDEGGRGWTSRKDRAAVNEFMSGSAKDGPLPLTLLRTPITDDEYLQKLQTKVWEGAEELRLIYSFEGWGEPGQRELFMYGMNNLTKAEQKSLGIKPLGSVPGRKDTRSDEQKLADAKAKAGAVEQGITSPFTG